jgi:chromosome segregation ATPase
MYELNPHAFTDNDINQLHIGSLLTVPDMKALSEEVPELLPSVPEPPPATGKIQAGTDGITANKQPREKSQLAAKQVALIEELITSNRNTIASLQKLIARINGFQQGSENLQLQITEIKQQLKLAMNKMQLIKLQQTQSSTAPQGGEAQQHIDEIRQQLRQLQQQKVQPQTQAASSLVNDLQQQITGMNRQLQQMQSQQTGAMTATNIEELQRQVADIQQQQQLAMNQLQQYQQRQALSRQAETATAPAAGDLQNQITGIRQEQQRIMDQLKQVEQRPLLFDRPVRQRARTHEGYFTKSIL